MLNLHRFDSDVLKNKPKNSEQCYVLHKCPSYLSPNVC